MFFPDTDKDEFYKITNFSSFCVPEYHIEKPIKSSIMDEKSILYDEHIKKSIQRIIERGKVLINKSTNEEKTKDSYKKFKIKIENLKKDFQDKKYNSIFTDYSMRVNFLNSNSRVLNYFDILKETYTDFNANFFEYYLMANHIEKYSCCFIYTMRELAVYFKRTINSGKYYCYFDIGIKNLIDKLNSDIYEKFKYTKSGDDDTDDNPNASIESVSNNQMEYNLNLMNTKFQNYLDVFREGLINLYNKYFDLYTKIGEFLIDIKIILKIISIVNIITTAKKDDLPMFKSFNSSISNILISGEARLTPMTFKGYYTQQSFIVQQVLTPYFIEVRTSIDTIPINKINKFNDILITNGINDTGKKMKCENLKEELSNINKFSNIDYIHYYKKRIDDTNKNSLNLIKDKNDNDANSLKDKINTNSNDAKTINDQAIITITGEKAQDLYNKIEKLYKDSLGYHDQANAMVS